MRKQMWHRACALLFLVLATRAQAQDEIRFQEPPKDIRDLALAETSPTVSFGQQANWMLQFSRSSYPSIEELAQPELRIAGLRLNPAVFGPSRTGFIEAIRASNLRTGQVVNWQGMPSPLRAGNVAWSENEQKFAFTQLDGQRFNLYVADLLTGTVKRINERPLNLIIGSPFSWIGNDSLVYKVIPSGNRQVPGKPAAPAGPVVQESRGRASAARTYQDMIRSPYDEALFAYYATSELAIYDGSREKVITPSAIYSNVDVSPDNRFLLVRRIEKPFSYILPASGFPHRWSVYGLDGTEIKVLANNPSAEGQPIGFDDVSTFPRNFSWRADQPATVMYVQALDNGLGRKAAEWRDGIYTTTAMGKDAPALLARTRMRFRDIVWGDNQLALLYEGLTANRRLRMNRLNPSNGQVDSLYERSSNDAYADIGSPLTKKNAFGEAVLLRRKNGQLVLRSSGASPEGDMPLIQTYDLAKRNTSLIWRCKAPYYENVIYMVDADAGIFITSRESLTEVPNYFMYDLRKKILQPKALTDFRNPYPQLEGIGKEKISYKRADGIDLTGNLYLPKGYDPKRDGRLPVLIWAYPREYKSAADAAQVRGSQYTFTRLNWGSPIYWVTQGYAVLDNAEMPIVGEGKQEPNDAFIPQLYLNAHAAIQELWRRGVGDSNRVAVGGHSYGAFMTANLLAHTGLFKAGIARSGAYNRTLTPFGFQAEERTYWQAPQVYYNMSPFSFADKIKTPLLLIHGELDNNSGTFPIQSERLFQAVQGLGGTVRFVQLPFESHGYASRENILHMLWEQHQWLEKHVKSAK